VLGALIPEWSQGQEPVPDRSLLLHEAALRLLRVLAGAAGALVTLEDLHWPTRRRWPWSSTCMSNPGFEDLLYGLKAGHLPVRL
jgi:hypothetical protein